MEEQVDRPLRASAEFPVMEREGRFSFWVRGVNLSTTGLMVNRGDVPLRSDPGLVHLELHLPRRSEPMRVMASSVWIKGSLEGLKFLGLTDADRLTLAEEIDQISADGGALH